ncbi:hypothetical protein D3C78_1455740 [compost metagenome]
MSMKKVRVAVLCRESGGVPAIFYTQLTVSEEQYNEGFHYELAIELAIEEGYEGEMQAFDEFDTAGRQLHELAQFFAPEA